MAGVYVHIPYCASKCGYCAFNSSSDFSSVSAYVERLIAEIEANPCKDITSIYFGGGTPSVLSPKILGDIFAAIEKNGKIATSAEITVECNPDSCDENFLRSVKSIGFNRLSMGAQSTDDTLLKRIGRRHNAACFFAAYERARKFFDNVSVDVMIGLPGQTTKKLRHTLDDITGLCPEHISAYALSVEEGTPFYIAGVSVDEDAQAIFYDLTVEALQAAGYERYEVSNFCVGDKFSRHNAAYWDLTDYYGYGVSAHSLIDGYRYANTDNLEKYIIGSRQIVEKADKIEEYIMLALRTKWGIDLQKLKELGCDLMKEKRQKIDNLIKQGILEHDGSTLKLSPSAYFIMDAAVLELV